MEVTPVVTVKCEPVDVLEQGDMDQLQNHSEPAPGHNAVNYPQYSQQIINNMAYYFTANSLNTEIKLETDVKHEPEESEGADESKKKIKKEDRVKCPLCPKTFKNQANMKSHVTHLHTENAVECPQCNRNFKSYAHLKSHVDSVHVAEGEAKACDLCGKEFANKKKLSNHKFYAHSKPEERVTCPICNKSFAKKYKLRVHNRNVHNPGEAAKCPQCDKEYKSKMLLRRHMLWSHPEEGKTYVCEDCGKEFPTFPVYKKHTWNVHGASREMTCEICHRTLASKKSWLRHMRCVHKDGRPAAKQMKVGTLPCMICDRKFTTNTALYWHLEQTHSEVQQNSKTCPICSKKFTEYYVMRRHLEMVHPIETATCEICNKTFKSAANLESHMRVTHAPPEAAKQCDMCQKIFKCSMHLRIHMNTVHPKDGKATCDICNREFASKRYLASHKQIHVKVRQFHCAICGKSFKRQVDLSKHTRKVHNKKKPKTEEVPVSKCLKCGTCFTNDQELHEHIVSCENTGVNLSIVKIEVEELDEGQEVCM